jgi:hypothetical protein
MGGECNKHGRYENYITILVGKSERKRPFGIHRRNLDSDVLI